jgi:hypothetical protein
VANAHQFNFEKWAEMWGLDYLKIESADTLEIEGGERTLVVELVPSASQTDVFWEAYSQLSNVE